MIKNEIIWIHILKIFFEWYKNIFLIIKKILNNKNYIFWIIIKIYLLNDNKKYALNIKNF